MDNIRPPLTQQDTDKINLPSDISLREYLAGQALAGLIGSEHYITTPYDKLATEIVNSVDALITELNRTKQ